MRQHPIIDALRHNGGPLALAAAAEIERLQKLAEQRSQASHNHQWAEIAELWQTLPESMSDLPYAQSPEALRKHALIARGYCDVTTVDAGSKAAAERVASVSERLARLAHGYAVVKVQGPVVTIATPHSQSHRAMGKALFHESKAAVLDWIHAKLEDRP